MQSRREFLCCILMPGNDDVLFTRIGGEIEQHWLRDDRSRKAGGDPPLLVAVTV